MHSIFKDKKVFLTGHTGFKGSWMLQILNLLGAHVKGYALPPENEHDLYHQIDGDRLCYASVVGNVLDYHLLNGELIRFEPDFVFHFAAQSLVRRSYDQPVETFNTNVIGTLNVLEALRGLKKKCVAIMVTTDKVYENLEQGQAFKETDQLGGHDPYSASKAAAEIAIASFRKSFFPIAQVNEHQKSIIAVRSGNVIGGGDYSEDRIIPDIMRSIEREEQVTLRNPKAIRPWQHVLEPLDAYLTIAEKAYQMPESVSEAYNIGPENSDVLSVEFVTKKFIEFFGKGSYQVVENPHQVHEAQTLLLDNEKIKRELSWHPKYNAQKALQLTAEWYGNKTQNAAEKSLTQIKDYLH